MVCKSRSGKMRSPVVFHGGTSGDDMDFSLVEVGTMVRTSRSGGVVWDDPYPFLGGRYEIWRGSQ